MLEGPSEFAGTETTDPAKHSRKVGRIFKTDGGGHIDDRCIRLLEKFLGLVETDLAALRERGPRVVVITNSLASTDGAMVHGGYKGYRKPLLRAGIELYELKPTPGVHRVHHGWNPAASIDTGLHSKTFSIDRRTLFVGSYNLDPRSKRLNTEIGALIDCPELASYLPETVDPVLATETYRLELDGNRLIWVTQEDGREVRYNHEPATSFWQRLNAEILSWLPIEGLL